MIPDALQLFHEIKSSSEIGARNSLNKDWVMIGWAVPLDTGTQDIINVNENQWVVEEGLKSEEQFCIAEESGILISREELGISNSKEHKLHIRNTTASSVAV